MNEEAVRELQKSNNLLNQIAQLNANILQSNKNIETKVALIADQIDQALAIAKRELG